jgi:hypothetical protein
MTWIYSSRRKGKTPSATKLVINWARATSSAPGANPLPICSVDGNADATYGTVAGANDADNVMGGGHLLTTLNAQPWIDRIKGHTQHSFRVTRHVDWLPRITNLDAYMRGNKTF